MTYTPISSLVLRSTSGRLARASVEQMVSVSSSKPSLVKGWVHWVSRASSGLCDKRIRPIRVYSFANRSALSTACRTFLETMSNCRHGWSDGLQKDWRFAGHRKGMRGEKWVCFALEISVFVCQKLSPYIYVSVWGNNRFLSIVWHNLSLLHAQHVAIDVSAPQPVFFFLIPECSQLQKKYMKYY